MFEGERRHSVCHYNNYGFSIYYYLFYSSMVFANQCVTHILKECPVVILKQPRISFLAHSSDQRVEEHAICVLGSCKKPKAEMFSRKSI